MMNKQVKGSIAGHCKVLEELKQNQILQLTLLQTIVTKIKQFSIKIKMTTLKYSRNWN